MDMDRYTMAERLLNLTLEIIYLLTGENHTVVKETSGECVKPRSPGLRMNSPINMYDNNFLLHERSNKQKILDLTNKIIEMLTGEVPIRCQDVAVFFSMEEWEYVEEHKDGYKDTIMENRQPLISLDLSSMKITPQRCLSPLHPEDCAEEHHSVSLDQQPNDGLLH
ncbi:gastrula zinc finger protein XlCGF66.1-like [Bufo gargarizans]|uniref:gastrula zinc finger protein XlCGF66.1-like n=1 Tax=Bufo gargarizans TaxID=30331 RepID=UPI001CF15137|nr:gastrula zinc finger protein XlCGF66.1-like [Bufo gargarizans]XP_044154525.1 gastrula zinc finger protein XlCGF66.1-like [Bufo gargarizans]XP_044154526.1 gastrula zinc finger protein XlCGF66.1-like [Bufo gargarizans]XP_044154527.1 gastrula zinc finger protein XlCGF66.1-like [Bufo gargarizans]XP_044154528.1 gastrula zinc finger protein XlCGF66.1-like [Bufo gargarizans]